MGKRVWVFTAFVITALLVFCSCKSNKATISGRFIGCSEESVVLEQVLPLENKVVDSVRTDSKGRYKFKVQLPSSEPTLYNLRIKNRPIVLFVAPGEKVAVTSLYGDTRKYTVEGSPESALVKEINDILIDGALRLDSIAKARSLYTSNKEDVRAGMAEYTREYHKIKRNHIKFIANNSTSLAALYALYQRLPNDDDLSGTGRDIIYYRMVADSAAKYHPNSPYLASLRTAIADFDAGEDMIMLLNEKYENPIPYPDIELSDMYGVRHKLSSYQGEVVLLDFWSASQPESAIRNAELKDIYREFSYKGFIIYQVSVDDSKPLWVKAVQEQNLPWISVCDFKGAGSPAVMAYNIKSVPANFLINSEGDIVGKNLHGEELEAALEKLFMKKR